MVSKHVILATVLAVVSVNALHGTVAAPGQLLLDNEVLPRFINTAVRPIPEFGQLGNGVAASASATAHSALGAFRNYIDDLRSNLKEINIPPKYNILRRFVNGDILPLDVLGHGLVNQAVPVDLVNQGLPVDLVNHGLVNQALPVDLVGHGLVNQGLPVDLVGHGLVNQGLPVDLTGHGLVNYGLPKHESVASSAASAASAATTGTTVPVAVPGVVPNIPQIQPRLYRSVAEMKNVDKNGAPSIVGLEN